MTCQGACVWLESQVPLQGATKKRVLGSDVGPDALSTLPTLQRGVPELRITTSVRHLIHSSPHIATRLLKTYRMCAR